ncbi:hypothetical protein KW796_02340 [Candidatus Parcubacteria bacterium]|nr:hypothetical protein [Candidatus Parcubacteria bacterium]
MLNPFPGLLIYSTLAPFILRIVLGFIFLDLGILDYRKKGYMKLLGIVEVIGALMLFIGFYTQIAALLFVIISAASFYIEYKADTILKRDIVFYMLLLAISISLLLTGAGAYAKDIPL